MRRSRAVAASIAAVLAVLLLAWWLVRGDATPPPAPVPDAGPAAPPPAPAAPVPPVPAPAPAEEPLAEATVRVLDAKYGEPAKESLLAAEAVAGPPGPDLAVEEKGPGVWLARGPRGTVVRVVASSAGFVPSERFFLLGPRPEMRIHLAPVGTVAIRVHAAKDGAPVPGARVHVAGEPLLFRGTDVGRAWLGRTDSAGIVNCPEAGPGRRLRVTAIADGFAPCSQALEAVPEGIEIVLQPGVHARLRVLDDHGITLPGALSVPVGLDGIPLLPSALEQSAGADGLVESWYPAGDDTSRGPILEIRCQGKVPAFVQGIDFRADPPPEVHLDDAVPGGITAVDESGSPLADFPVRLVPLETIPDPKGGDWAIPVHRALPSEQGQTNARGRFEAGAPAGRSLWLAAVGGAGEYPLFAATFTGEQLVRFPEVRIPDSRARTVTVSTPAGRPFRRAEVFLVPPGSFDDPAGGLDAWLRRAAPVLSGADGRASIRETRESPLEVVVLAGPFLWGVPDPTDPGTGRRVALRAPGRLRVRVRGDGGAPIPGALVRARAGAVEGGLPPALLDASAQEAVTGPDGAAEFDVPGGVPLLVEACATGGLDARESRVAPSGRPMDLEIGLRMARTIWVSVEDVNGRRIAGATIDAFFEGLTAPWLTRGVSSRQGVIPLSLPSIEEASPGGGRVFLRASGPVSGWATLPLRSLVEGGRIRFGLEPKELFVLDVAEDRLWPRGTPFEWVVENGHGTPSSGRGKVGEDVPMFLTPGDFGKIRVRLPDAVPVAPLSGSEALAASERRAYEGISGNPSLTAEQAATRKSEIRRLYRDPHHGWATVLPLIPQEAVNDTVGWARAQVLDSGTGKAVLLAGPVPRGARVRLLVPAEGCYTTGWVPVAAAPR